VKGKEDKEEEEKEGRRKRRKKENDDYTEPGVGAWTGKYGARCLSKFARKDE
jgi:hypothetical protein